MSVTLDDMRAWLAEQFENVELDGAISIVGCIHYSASGAENAIDAVSSKMASEKWNADAVAARMDMIATRHARGFSGVQQFTLQACFGTNGKPQRALPFQRVGGLAHGAMAGGGLATEGPHATGLTSMTQRWGEISIQAAAAKDLALTQIMGQLLDKLATRLETTERRSDERWLALQNLLLEWQKQSMSTQVRVLAIEAGRKLLPLLPAAVSTITGSDLVPQREVENSIFDTIVANYSGNQLAGLLSTLGSAPDGGPVAGMVADQLARAQKRRDDRAAAEHRYASGLPSRTYEEAERDAAGEAIRVLHNDKATTNGTTKTLPRAAKANDADDLLDVILGTVESSEIDMLVTMLAAKRPNAPDLEQRIRTRFAAVKGEGQP